jgi:hypothetical protein
MVSGKLKTGRLMMVMLSDPPRNRINTNARHRAYLLMIAGIFIVLVAYGLLLFQDASSSGIIPITLALGGFLIATSGFSTFVKFEKAARLTHSLPSPLFECDEPAVSSTDMCDTDVPFPCRSRMNFHSPN